MPDTGGDRLRLMLGEAPARFDAPGAVVEVLDARAIGAAYSVAAAETVRFVYRQFYFPGWLAMLDGQRARLEITQPEGLMAVAVPAGVHTLTFALGATPPRLAGEGLSLLALLATAGWAAALTLLARRAGRAAIPRAAAPLVARGINPMLLAVAALLALARPLLFDAGRTPLLRARLRPDGLAGVPPLNLDVAGELTLLGTEITPRALSGDQDLAVDLYWRAQHPLGVAYGFQARLVDAAGQTWSNVETTRPRDWRFAPGTDLWPVDQYVLDPYTITPLAGLPPGAYTVDVTVFAYYNLQIVGRYSAGQVTITRPTRARVCPESVPAVPAAALDLRAAELPVAGRPGDDLTAGLCWQAVTAPGADLAGELRLLDATNALRAAQPFTLGGAYPTSRWAAGDVLRDQVTLRVPAGLETGSYTWALLVAGGPQVGLGALAVTAPERQYAAPPVGEVAGADLGPITLYGLNLTRSGLVPGAELPVTLIWRADEAPSDSYHVFVHLQAADGRLVAQSDGVPADWGRRTTGWLRGEFVVDTRLLQLPIDLAPGAYTLAAGLYVPGSGARLTTAQFPDGRIALGAVQVETPAPPAL